MMGVLRVLSYVAILNKRFLNFLNYYFLIIATNNQ